MTEWHIAALTPSHERNKFACGHPSLDRFLKESARQNQDKNVSRTFVLTRDGSVRVLGYHTLAAGQIEKSTLPPRASKMLPGYPVPVVVLGRLALDVSVKGQKHGRRLLSDALERILTASESIGVYAVFVEAIDDSASNFYAHFGFEPLLDTPRKLYLPLDSIRDALDVNEG